MRVSVTNRGSAVTVGRGGVSVAVVGGGGAVTVGGLGLQGTQGPASPKGVALEWPVNGEDLTLFWTPYAVTMSDARAVVRTDDGGTVALEIRFGPDREAAGTLAATALVSSTSDGDAVPLEVADVPAGSYVWMVVTGVTGTVREVHVNAWF